MGKIAESAAQLRAERVNGQRLRIDEILDSVDADDRAAILGLVQDEQISIRRLADFLCRHGHEVGQTAVRTYRMERRWERRPDFNASKNKA